MAKTERQGGRYRKMLLEQQGQAKREKLLAEKVDINQYYLDEMDRLAKAGRKRA